MLIFSVSFQFDHVDPKATIICSPVQYILIILVLIWTDKGNFNKSGWGNSTRYWLAEPMLRFLLLPLIAVICLGYYFFPLLPSPIPYTIPDPTNTTVTPLFIGFTRNWDLVHQCAASYVAGGWPADQVYVVDNTGTMDSNALGALSPKNPFYLDHKALAKLGINVISTPTLLTFAQLQNFYTSTAIAHGWEQYFWSHQDVVAVSDEDRSFYRGVLDCLEEAAAGDFGMIWYAYDWLTYMRVKDVKSVGGWDNAISYYRTDCDMYSRLNLVGSKLLTCHAGRIYDVAEAVDITSFYNPTPKFRDQLAKLEEAKGIGEARNSWQKKQNGGQGDPFYIDPKVFQFVWDEQNAHGRRMYEQKWDDGECGVNARGKTLDDQWITL